MPEIFFVGEGKMKCLNCGNTEMFEVSMSQSFRHGEIITEPIERISSFACAKCGHIELFASEEMIKSYEEHKKKKAIAEKQKKELEEEQYSIRGRIDKLEKEIFELRKFVGDEHNTVKQVKEGKEKIRVLECELIKLESSLKDLDDKIERIMS